MLKNISALYYECHAVTHASTRLLGDSRVNLVIDNKLKRESQYIRKQPDTVCVEDAFKSAMNYNCVQGEIPSATTDTETETPNLVPMQKFIDGVKIDVKVTFSLEESQSLLNHVKTFVKQGLFLELNKLEQMDAT